MLVPIPPASASAVARAATQFTVSAPAWTPRVSFDASVSTPRSYYLGHHAAGLAKMRQSLAHVGLIIECRDARAPLTTWNPLLSRTLTTADDGTPRARIVVYTKRDLAPPTGRRFLEDLHRPIGSDDDRAPGLDAANSVVFATNAGRGGGVKRLLDRIKDVARERDCLMGLRCLVVGMPNTGKSSLVNRLRSFGMRKGKAERTGAGAGVTRKMSGPVRIVPAEAGPDDEGDDDNVGMGEGVFVVDTPGVFVTYVNDPESMLKLALMGCVKDGLVPAVTLADYLLYHMNLNLLPAAESRHINWQKQTQTQTLTPHTPPVLSLPAPLSVQPCNYTRRFELAPTNDVHEFLSAVGSQTGKLMRGGEVNLAHTADWVVREFRAGRLGPVLLDDVTPETIARTVAAVHEPSLSLHQARKKEKAERKKKNLAKFAAARDYVDV